MRKFWSDILYLVDRRDMAHFGVLVASLLINSALELAALASVPFFMASAPGSPYASKTWRARKRPSPSSPRPVRWCCC